MAVSIQEYITKLRALPTYGRFLVQALQMLESSVNQVGTNLAADPTQTLPAPPPIQAVNVSANSSGLVHTTITHNSQTQRNTNYFLEWSSDPNFVQNVYPEHLGASRHKVLTLPNGTWYMRGFHQLSGSMPSTPVNYGGTNPTSIVVSGSSALTLLDSPGSGTAAPNGTQPGWGLGKTLYRAKPGPKRTSAK